MAKSNSKPKRYLLSMMPVMFTHLEELAREQTQRTGQFITIAALIRNAIQSVYPLVGQIEDINNKEEVL